MDAVIAYLRDHHAEHLDWALDLCRIPSVSTLPEHRADVAAAVRWTRDLCERIGLRAEIHKTEGHPFIYADHCQAPDAPTLLVYGHLDVQPTGDRALWDADPFQPVVRDGWLIARGAADNKGQVLVHLRAAGAWLAAHQRLPLNLKFLIEAEEEIGSPNLAPFIQDHQDLLRCDHILISDTGMYADGWPTITCGTRGILSKEIRLFGPKHDLHSGSFGGTVANPANELATIVASLHDADGRVTIPGFYDDVAELSTAERDQFRALPLNDDEYAANVGCPGIYGEKGYSTNERRWVRPTLDVNGIYGGFMGEGANTIIPNHAGAKITMRLVPNQDGQKLSAAFEQTIRDRCPASVRLEIIDRGFANAYLAPPNSPPMQAAHRALQEAFDREPALIREGGSLPILPLFKRALNADSLLLGFASPDCNAHGPNEKVCIADLNRGAEAAARLFAYLAP